MAARYSDAQRGAIYDLYKEGRSAREIAELCAAGEARVPAFTIPERSVRHIARQMARQRGFDRSLGRELSLDEWVESAIRKAMGICERELASLDVRSRRGEDVSDRLAGIARTLAEVQRTAAALRKRSGSSPNPAKPKSDFLDKMGREIHARKQDELDKVAAEWRAEERRAPLSEPTDAGGGGSSTASAPGAPNGVPKAPGAPGEGTGEELAS